MPDQKIKTPGARHPVLKSYGVIHPTDLLCPKCGEAVYHGSKKQDATDATLPKSVYACRCAYFSSTQLILPLRVEEWEQQVNRAAGDGAVVEKGIDPIVRAAQEVNALHGELLAMGLEMIAKMIVIGEKLVSLKADVGHGNWEAWVKDKLTFSSRTARRYMDVYRHRDDPSLKDDPVEFLNRIHGHAQLTTNTSELTTNTPKSDAASDLDVGAARSATTAAAASNSPGGAPFAAAGALYPGPGPKRAQRPARGRGGPAC